MVGSMQTHKRHLIHNTHTTHIPHTHTTHTYHTHTHIPHTCTHIFLVRVRYRVPNTTYTHFLTMQTEVLLVLLGILLAAICVSVSTCSAGSKTTEPFVSLTPNDTPAAPTTTPHPPHSLLPQCSPPQDMAACMQSCDHGWCMDRQGGGKCVPGFLDGPFDPGQHCNNWWFKGMCLTGPLCRRTDVVPPPSVERGWYHHPAPYYYRSTPWNTGQWCGLNRCYDKPVVLATVFQ